MNANGGPPSSWYSKRPNQKQLTMLDTIEPEPIVFVEAPFLMASTFHLLTGVKNCGKGTWLASIAARVTRGQLGEHTHVIWLALDEDSIAQDVIPRLLAHDGDRAKVSSLVNQDFTLPDDGQWLEDAVREQDAGMVVIDPLGGAILGRDSNDERDVRQALRSLNRIADNTGAMVFGVRHISNKMQSRRDGGLSAVLGHSDWVNVPRVVLALLHDDRERAYRHLFLMTGNRSPDDQPGQLLLMEGAQIVEGGAPVAHLAVVGESEKDPDELLAARPERGKARNRTLVLRLLADAGGTMNSDMLDYEIGKLTGAAVKTVRNTRIEMNNQGLIGSQRERSPDGRTESWNVFLKPPGYLELSTTPSPSKPGFPGSLDDLTHLSGPGFLQAKTPHPGGQKPGPGANVINTWKSPDPDSFPFGKPGDPFPSDDNDEFPL